MNEEREAAKVEWVARLGGIANQVKAAVYCKRELPSLNQINAFLKKEHNASKKILDGINENNVTEKFAAVV